MSKYGVFPGPYFPANVGKYGPEKTPYLDTFHAVIGSTGSIKTLIVLHSCKYLMPGGYKREGNVCNFKT